MADTGELEQFLEDGKTIDDVCRAIKGHALDLVGGMDVSLLVKRAVLDADEDDRARVLVEQARLSERVADHLCARYMQLSETLDLERDVFGFPSPGLLLSYSRRENLR